MYSEFLKNTEANWILRSSGIFYLRIVPHIFMILHVKCFQDAGEDSILVKVVLFKDNPFVCWKFYILERYRAFWGHIRIQMPMALCSESVCTCQFEIFYSCLLRYSQIVLSFCVTLSSAEISGALSVCSFVHGTQYGALDSFAGEPATIIQINTTFCKWIVSPVTKG